MGVCSGAGVLAAGAGGEKRGFGAAGGSANFGELSSTGSGSGLGKGVAVGASSSFVGGGGSALDAPAAAGGAVAPGANHSLGSISQSPSVPLSVREGLGEGSSAAPAELAAVGRGVFGD